jgi:Fic family protein
MAAEANRAGSYVRQAAGYRAFIPRPLPPDPPVAIDSALAHLLSSADQALGRLDGATDMLPHPDLFVFMYVRKEAVLSSQIEGTQASLMDVLKFEADAADPSNPQDVEEVVNYVAAMNHGLKRLSVLPVSMRLIREIHARLMQGVRGEDKRPGEFRRSQNWIGPPGSTLTTAHFVPPPPHEMLESLHDLERFLHDERPMPALQKIGLAHAQFETIHPFLDGNGRVGRLLITLLLCEREILRRPLLYLSYYFRKHQEAYYTALQNVRDRGDWEGWLEFFIRGVRETSDEATETARRVVRMREQHRELIQQRLGTTAAKALSLLESLYRRPAISIQHAADATKLAFPNAGALVGRFVELGLLREMTGRRRNRRFAYRPYLELFENGGPGQKAAMAAPGRAGQIAAKTRGPGGRSNS